MKPRRLFFALWPNDAERAQIVSIADQVQSRHASRIITTNLHITLAFLGSVSESQYLQLCQMAGQLRCAPLSLRLDRIELWQRAGIICLLPEQVGAELLALRQALDSGLASCGLPPEQRPYCPHVSLFRNARDCAPLEAIEPVIWRASEFCLVQSGTHLGGVEYRVLQRWPLQN
jgi:2'-5' RNA ligase